MSRGKSGLTPQYAFLIYLLALILVSFHEMPRIADWIEGMALSEHSGQRVIELSGRIKSISDSIGLSRLMATEKTIFTVAQRLPAVGDITEPIFESSLHRGAVWVVSSRDWVPGAEARLLESGKLSKPTPMVQPETPKPLETADPVQPAPSKPIQKARLKPKKILIAGDSMILEGFGVALERSLKERPGLTVVRKGKYSSGLTRPDYFDWMAYLEKLLDEHKPEVMIVSLGANDPQDILDENKKRHFVGSESWNKIYGERALKFLKIAREKGVLTFWVGLPIMGQAKYGERIENLNRIVQAQCEAVPGAIYVDTWLTLADKKDKYTTFITNKKGKHIRIRAKDKIHLTEAGGEIMVDHFLKSAALFVQLPGDKEDSPPVQPVQLPHTANPVPLVTPADAAEIKSGAFFSQSRGRETLFYAFIPITKDNTQRFPALYLLDGDVQERGRLTDQFKTQLLSLSKRYRLVIVVPDEGRYGWYADSPVDSTNQIETYLFNELIPVVEANLPVIKDLRAIAGLSMGGHGALVLALRHPQSFISVSSISGVTNVIRHADQWELSRVFGPYNQETEATWKQHSAMHLTRSKPNALSSTPILLSVSKSDSVLEENRNYNKLLEEQNIPHEYQESSIGEGWKYWASQLPIHVAFHSRALNQARDK